MTTNDKKAELKAVLPKEEQENLEAPTPFIRAAARIIINLITSILLCLSIISSSIITLCYLISICPLIMPSRSSFVISLCISLCIILGPYLFFWFFFCRYSISNTRITRILYPIGLSISGASLLFCFFIFWKYISLDAMTGSLLVIFALINPVSIIFCLMQSEKNLLASISPHTKKWIYLKMSIVVIIAIITIIAILSGQAKFLIQTLTGIAKGA